MTTNSTPTDELLPVTQADRDAAADVIKSYREQKNGDWQRRVREGRADDGAIVQAFARHRLASTTGTGQSALADELERLSIGVIEAPWMGYSEPEVGLPYSLFSGTPGQSGFSPIEPMASREIDFIAALVNNLPTILSALRTEIASPQDATPDQRAVEVSDTARAEGERP